MNVRERIAAAFHAAYEGLSGMYGYRTRADSAVPWADVPAANKDLMIATVGQLLQQGVIRPGDPIGARTVYVSIGNSDDKLPQAEWADFVTQVGYLMHKYCRVMHGFWLSPSDWRWQNACWCIEVTPATAAQLRAQLSDLCRRFRQDSIAWAEATTDFINPE
ncbi:hypothetical protein AB0K18_42905 [Nonomuraea sp. NPDC049421]|uniref:hypothetical protein n=1 Tax=Nonomuraea sp. NPDC049421 TaxID=3155275 RepID=UPI0034277A0C